MRNARPATRADGVDHTVKLTIAFPAIGPAIDGGAVARWHKAVGDTVAYGDDLVDFEIKQVTRWTPRLGERLRNPKRAKQQSDIRVIYRVTSMDSGTLAEIVAPPGTQVTVGDVVGALDTGDGHDGAAEARTTFNLVGAGPEEGA